MLTGSKIGEDSKKRMHIMTSTTNGFIIAEQDLQLRGPGDMYGTRQSGALKFRLADIVQDATLMEQARQAAQWLVSQDSDLSMPQHAALREMLGRQGQSSFWGKIS
jgi:ATP-dependent DNA helicase RecG